MNDKFVFDILTHPSDYRETAKIIYGTDPYIYRDLFGDVENAQKILSYSFDNPESVFFKNAVYIVKSRITGEVVSCALFHTNDFVWDSNIMLSDFEKAGVVPPRSFFAAAEYMIKTYNFRKIGCSMCNISVKEEFRRQGIAFFMLTKLLKRNDDKTVELTVLKDNVNAINLYKKLGFRIIGEPFKDYGGHNSPEEYCYKMVLNR